MKVITNEIIKRFENYLYEEERSKNTIMKYMRDVRAFYAYAGERDLEKNDILEYKARLSEKYSPKSVNSMLSSLNALFNFTRRYDLKVKTLKIQRQIFAGRDKELTKNEYERLLSAARENQNEALYYLMQTICSTGIRVGELRFIDVTAVRRGRAEINCKGKMRTVFLPDTLCKMLKDYIKRHKIASGSVFVTKSGKPIDRSNIWRRMKAICARARVEPQKVFPHNLRHLFARTYYSAQKDLSRLADILGHTSVETTRIYTAESGEVHCRQIQRLGLLKC